MPRSYTQRYNQKQRLLRFYVGRGHGPVTPDEADAIRELCNAFDENRLTVSKPRWPNAPDHLTNYREASTLASWMYHLMAYARRINLLDTDERELNQVAERFLNGEDPIKDNELAKGSIRAYQNTARIFYRYHDLGVDPIEIQVFERESSGIQPRDMLDGDEIQAIREVTDHPRDAAIVDMLLYTGLRNRALRTLKIKHIDSEDGKFYFNTDEHGLKDIHKPNAPRPLLGAVASVREWLKYHPFGDNEESYFIVGKPKWGHATPDQTVSDKTIQRVMDSVKEDAEIQKPLHPHSLRHNAVCIWKRDYDMDNSTIKFLIGHSPDSDVMETTYSHLSAQDYKQKAELAAGLREEPDESPYTPKFCTACNEPLPENAKVCHRCETPYTPDAQSVQTQIEDALYEAKGDVTMEDEELVDKLRQNIQNDAELKALLVQYLSD